MKSDDMEEKYELAKWLAGEMTEAELAAFRFEPDFVIYEKIRTLTSTLEAPGFDEQKMLAAIVNSPKEKAKAIPFTQNWFFRIAAILVIGLGLFFSLKNFASYTQTAGNGTQNRFLLPDNSEVVLNSGSEIQYKKWNWNNQRALDLTGEAYFKVAKGKTFEVNTPLGKVTVVGTQFNVKQRDQRFDITCYEGKVKVNYQDEELLLTKGMHIAFENGKRIPIPENTTQSPEWLSNEIVFYQASLKSVLAELERRFDVKLVLQSPESNQLFTGTIPAKDSNVALEIITSSYHLKPAKVNSKSLNKNIIHLKPVDVSE